MRKAAFLVSPALWEHGHGPAHPLKPERLQRTYRLLQEYGALETANVQVVTPRTASEEELALFHSREYISVVRSLSAGGTDIPAYRYNFGPGDNPVYSGMFESGSLVAGSALLAAEMLLNGVCEVAFSYSGGLHHARPEQASGFCVFNDAAVAIHWLVKRGLRVAYVDIDVHHGDGVQWAFYDSDRVLTISLHQDGRTLFPGSGLVDEIGKGAGVGYSVNLPLPPYTDDELYCWAFDEIVPPLVSRFQPDITVTQLGVDTHYLDPLANLALTTRGQSQVFKTLEKLAGHWLALGGGGYNLDVVPRSWTLAFAVMSGQSLPDELPEDYRVRYGGRWLQDLEAPLIPEREHRYVQQIVEATVARLKQLHHLS